MREVPRLVSDSVWSSVLVSEVELLELELSEVGDEVGGTGGSEGGEWGAGMLMLGVTWKRPMVWGEPGTELEGDGVGLGPLPLISLTAGFIGELREDKVLSGLSVGEEDRSDEDAKLKPSV